MSSLSFFDFTMQHVRLALLRVLLETPTHSANDSVLTMQMIELGLPVTRAQLRTQLGWLAEQGLIRITRPIDTLIVASLRERGGEVATGRAQVDGVPRPTPGR